MVHALNEAHRVLKPNGLLIDLRPAPKHRRVGLGQGKRWRLVGIMREGFDDDRAADRAVKQVILGGLFRSEMRLALELDRMMDTMEDFCAWLDDFARLGKTLPSHAWLIQRLRRAREKKPANTKLVVRGSMMLRVMRRLNSPAATPDRRGSPN